MSISISRLKTEADSANWLVLFVLWLSVLFIFLIELFRISWPDRLVSASSASTCIFCSSGDYVLVHPEAAIIRPRSSITDVRFMKIIFSPLK